MPKRLSSSCQTCGQPCRDRFCSKRCYGQSMVTRIPTVCSTCGWPFLARRGAVANGMGRYCSKPCSNRARKRSVSERFLDFYRPGLPDECWPWTGSLDKEGYGYITDGSGGQLRAHRLAYELAHGPADPDKHVMHTCDNPPCCNPNHLRLGTADDNNKDKARKLRASSKLTVSDVVEIRRLLACGAVQAHVAKRFGVSAQNILAIKKRRTWIHVA